MKTVKEHYDQQLASVYSWMAGGWEPVTERNRAFFRGIELDKLPTGLAIDLGAGSGFQSIPLAEFGFRVIAVDFNSTLLAELRMHAGQLSIQTVQDDLLNFKQHIKEAAQIIVCMGDTLTHLKSSEAVETLLQEAAGTLVTGGVLILTFRDYVSTELIGKERFIPVQADESKIFTCFLEYHENFVEVFDLLHLKEGAQWKLEVSSYPKLRLGQGWVQSQLQKVGLTVARSESAQGMIKIIAEKK